MARLRDRLAYRFLWLCTIVWLVWLVGLACCLFYVGKIALSLGGAR